MGRHVVAAVAEIPPGGRRIVELEGRSIGVFNVGGTFYALRNSCPHQAGPLCLGRVRGTMLPSAPGEYLVAREGEILCCPWHGWEFDITTGRAIFDPETTRVRSYPVEVEPADARVETYPTAAEAGMVVVYVGRPHDAEIRHRRPD